MPSFLFGGYFGKCQHRSDYGMGLAVLYCVTLSTLYVGSLYVLVPPKVRRLDRDHTRHIQWRSFATTTVALGAIGSYPRLFCKSYEKDLAGYASNEVFLLGRNVFGVLLHIVLLYLGPIILSVLQMAEVRRLEIARGRKRGSYWEEIMQQIVMPPWNVLVNPKERRERWKMIRNFVVAPWTEEVVFRGCMVPALLGADMTPVAVALIAPLFFGVAHVHHAATRISKGEPIQPVLFMTLFQFLYTSLFGMYASHALIRTGSVPAVTVGHAYCNYMGLPSISFFQPNNPMYKYRMVVLAAFVVGTFGFKTMFSRTVLLPLPSVLTTSMGFIKSTTPAS